MLGPHYTANRLPGPSGLQTCEWDGDYHNSTAPSGGCPRQPGKEKEATIPSQHQRNLDTTSHYLPVGLVPQNVLDWVYFEFVNCVLVYWNFCVFLIIEEKEKTNH